MLNLCGETEEKLAQELLVFEVQIERDVVDPLYALAEVSVFFLSKLHCNTHIASFFFFIYPFSTLHMK